MTTTGRTLPRPTEHGLLGEVDGLDLAPALDVSRLRGDGGDGPALATGYAILALALVVTMVLYTSILSRPGLEFDQRPPPTRHPFEVSSEAGPGSIIMEVRGDPIMIVRRDDARPRRVALSLPAALADGPADVPTALAVVDELVSETGGFMGSLPADDTAGTISFLASADEGSRLTAEDLDAVMSGGYAASGEVSVAEYSLLEADIPPEPSDVAAEADVAALVRATAVARGWIDLPRRSGRGTEATAAIIRELGRNASRLDVAPAAGLPVVEEARLSSVVDEAIGRLLLRNGFPAEASDAVEAAFREFHGVATVGAGDRLFVRSRRVPDGTPQPVQVALGGPTGFVGAVALGGDGALVPAEEPWGSRPEDDRTLAMPMPTGGYTLRDGIYSAGVRNAMPEPIVREAIAVLGRTTDLSAPAKPGDRVEFVFTEVPRDPASGAGRVVYVGLQAGGATRPCYVFRSEPGGPFGCLDATGGAASAEGMIAPVRTGRLTSRFGMRVHPILKYARLHKGIDWGAPIGTPVYAVAPGTVTFAGVASGYGNYVKIAHDERTVTAYAHLDQFESGLAAGQKVAQGDRIGFLGTSGMSTGPHLHFELYVGGEPVDPLTNDFRIAADGAPDPARAAAFADRKAIVDRVLLHAVP